ncbi:hypothetical protein C5167_047804 [Papaver somniferum]|uniref:Invertebrate defensins family profile domain-containing protein n=1 Tax=Papaver somniferum TaxID=3469 RepID=A0A4Y7LJ86_PAPSO|nr:hypothetical protein C5167_047804 [Papaver somniferum]
MKMGSSSMKIVMALALCLLLLGGFSAEAAGRINDGAAAAATTAIQCVSPASCPGAKDCNSCCISLGYNPGGVVTHRCCCRKK